jgi:hypothetical protein
MRRAAASDAEARTDASGTGCPRELRRGSFYYLGTSFLARASGLFRIMVREFTSSPSSSRLFLAM